MIKSTKNNGHILTRLAAGWYALSCLSQEKLDLHDRGKWYSVLDCISMALNVYPVTLPIVLKEKTPDQTRELVVNAVTRLNMSFNALTGPTNIFDANRMLRAGQNLLTLIKTSRGGNVAIHPVSANKLLAEFFNVDEGDVMGVQLIIKTKAVMAMISERNTFLEERVAALKPQAEA